jgi:hypothetical protein
VAVGSLGLVLFARLWFITHERFEATDLAVYEARSYGVDLPDWYGRHPFFLAWSRGDGQAFMTIAADPLAEGPAREFDNALYRYGRLGFSVLARVAVLGRIDLVPIGFVAVNALAVLWIGWVAGTHVGTWGRRALLLPLNPAVVIGFMADTAEVVAIATLLLAVVARRTTSAVAAAALLASTRESYSTASLLASRPMPVALAILVAVTAIRVVGVVALGLPWSGAGGNLALPFAGYLAGWQQQTTAAALVSAAVVAAGVVTLFKARRRSGWVGWAYLFTGALVVSVADLVVSHPVNLLRAAGALPVVWIAHTSVTRR